MASQMGNDKCIELLIKAGADANMVYNSEEIALAKAAAKSLVNCVKILLKAGADLNKCGMTPLMKATFNGNIECVRVLLQGGADVNKLHASLTALYYAGNYGRNEIVKLLLNAGADVNTGKNPLVAVLPSSGTHTAKITINAGADVNKVDEQLNTVLHNCASYEYMELLLKADIKINKRINLAIMHLSITLQKQVLQKKIYVCCCMPQEKAQVAGPLWAYINFQFQDPHCMKISNICADNVSGYIC